MEATDAIVVYTDGSCPFCQWSRGLVERRDKAGRITFRDLNDPEATRGTPFPNAELATAMHARTPDGTWHVGFWGWIAVLRILPRWRWMAGLLAAPPLRWLGPGFYRVIARNRYR